MPRAAAGSGTGTPRARRTPPAGNNRGDGRRRVSNSPWQGIVDAAGNAVRAFSDPVAMEGVNAIDTAADAIDGIADAFTAVGQTIATDVYWDPRVAHYFEELGRYIKDAAAPTRDGAAAVKNAHSEDIDRVVENDPRKRRWDIQAHD